jgi:EPS-associated MarR family transcriptional regulator
MTNDQDQFDLLRKINNFKKITQRQLATKLGFSLGKLNYCIKALKKKGLIKIHNFEKNQNKVKYMYILTPRGISKKTRLTINFMKLKLNEYYELKKELKKEK